MKPPARLGSLGVRAVGIGLCAPIDARLDQLLALARSEGRRSASRAAIVAALILDSPTTGREVISLLDRFEQHPEDESLIPGVPTPTLDVKKPGRRKASA
jgi:hypothetical protein